MGGMLGPYTPTVGQPFKLTIDRETKYIDVENDSNNDIWVFFGGNVKPTDLTNENNTWHRVVRRQHTALLPVHGYRGTAPSERRHGWAAFDGPVWLLAVNAGSLALSGSVSGRNQVYITPYLEGEPTPLRTSSATQVDLSSQPRIVALPYGGTHWASGQWNPGSGSTIQTQSFNIPAFELAALSLVYYLNALKVYPSQANGASGTMDWALVIQPRDSGGVALGSPANLYVGCAAVTVSAGLITYTAGEGIALPNPIAVAYDSTLPVGTTHVTIDLVKQLGNNVVINYFVEGNIDNVNSVPIAEPGNFGLYVVPNGPTF